MPDGGVRSASARADTPVETRALDRAGFARLEHERPALATRRLRNLLQGLMQTAVPLTREVEALEG